MCPICCSPFLWYCTGIVHSLVICLVVTFLQPDCEKKLFQEEEDSKQSSNSSSEYQTAAESSSSYQTAAESSSSSECETSVESGVSSECEVPVQSGSSSDYETSNEEFPPFNESAPCDSQELVVVSDASVCRTYMTLRQPPRAVQHTV